MRRTTTNILHWLTLVLLVLLIADGTTSVVAWGVALAGLTYCGLALAGARQRIPPNTIHGIL